MDRAELSDPTMSGGNPLISAEKALRLAQMEDSLDAVKRLLKSKTSTKDYTRRNVFGQRGNTRAQTAFKLLEKKIKMQADRYRRGYCALLILDPDGQWRGIYQCLENSDLKIPLRRRNARGDSADEYEDGDKENENPSPTAGRRAKKTNGKRKRRGEGHRTNSWIWTLKRSSSEEEGKEADDGDSLPFNCQA